MAGDRLQRLPIQSAEASRRVALTLYLVNQGFARVRDTGLPSSASPPFLDW